MAYEFKITRRVEFSETDAAGLVHFSNFFRYMESVEHAFFRSLGTSIHPHNPDPATRVGWPRVHASCDFRKPIRFEDTFEAHLLVREKRQKSISYTIVFRNAAGEEIARGALAVACVRFDPETGKMSAVPIPEWIASRIEPAPAELL